MEFFITTALNGLSYGLMLFMLSAGLTLTFSMMGVLNFAHASFYMLGAYLGFSIAQRWGFWAALVLAPLAVGVLGALFERLCLRRVHALGHVPELLVTFGLSYIVLEIVQLVWGRSALDFSPPPSLQGPAFTLQRQPQARRLAVMGAHHQRRSPKLCIFIDQLFHNRCDVQCNVLPAGLLHRDRVSLWRHLVRAVFVGVPVCGRR